MKLTSKEIVLCATIRSMAVQLEVWADESSKGGWSTHQVDPMRKKSSELRSIVRSIDKLDESLSFNQKL